ncbi:MAG: glycosyl transferase family 1 [Gemmatales bacterium]|nr:MAG: glycosyl transferase family 1 [Gemmatales bacterium]
MMRLAHFVQRYPPALGGSEAYFGRLSEFFARAGQDVTVFTTQAKELSAFWSPHAEVFPPGNETVNGVEVRRYPLWRFRGRRYLLKTLSFLPEKQWQCLTMPCNPISFRMWRDCQRLTGHFDLVHATAFPYAWPIACGLRLARRARIPFLLTPFLHLGDPGNPKDRIRRAYTKPPLRWLLHQADIVFVQTESEEKAVLDGGVASERIIRLGMGVDPEECTGGDREAARRQWQLTSDTIAIGHLANQSEEKGTVDLVRAAQKLWEAGNTNAVLVLAGPVMPNFQRFMEKQVPKGRVIQLGVLSEQAKRNFFAGIDLFVLPSRSDSFGLVLLEAWANGKANIGYKAGGIADVIRHEEDGLLVRCGRIDELAHAMARLASDADARKRFGANGLERTRREFVWRDKLQRVHDVYIEVLESRRCLRPAKI